MLEYLLRLKPYGTTSVFCHNKDFIEKAFKNNPVSQNHSIDCILAIRDTNSNGEWKKA